MKIQIKPVTIRELFPRKRNLDKVGDNYIHDLRITKVPYIEYGKRHQAYPYTRKELAEQVSKKLSMSVEEVMTIYKDKIETAYWKNLREVFIAEIVNEFTYYIYDQSDKFLADYKNGKESPNMIPKNVPSLENYNAEDLYGNMSTWLHKDLYINADGEYVYQTNRAWDWRDHETDDVWNQRPQNEKEWIIDQDATRKDKQSISDNINKIPLEIYDTDGKIVYKNIINIIQKYGD